MSPERMSLPVFIPALCTSEISCVVRNAVQGVAKTGTQLNNSLLACDLGFRRGRWHSGGLTQIS